MLQQLQFPKSTSSKAKSKSDIWMVCLLVWMVFMPSATIFNFLPNDKISDWSKLKEFADDKIDVTEKLKFVLGRKENIVRKGENAGSHKVFKRLLSQSH